MAYAIRAFVRSSRRKVRCCYPIVNYYLLCAASTPRESITYIIKPASIRPKTGPEKSLDRRSGLWFVGWEWETEVK